MPSVSRVIRARERGGLVSILQAARIRSRPLLHPEQREHVRVSRRPGTGILMRFNTHQLVHPAAVMPNNDQ